MIQGELDRRYFLAFLLALPVGCCALNVLMGWTWVDALCSMEMGLILYVLMVVPFVSLAVGFFVGHRFWHKYSDQSIPLMLFVKVLMIELLLTTLICLLAALGFGNC